MGIADHLPAAKRKKFETLLSKAAEWEREMEVCASLINERRASADFLEVISKAVRVAEKHLSCCLRAQAILDGAKRKGDGGICVPH